MYTSIQSVLFTFKNRVLLFNDYNISYEKYTHNCALILMFTYMRALLVWEYTGLLNIF